MNKKSDLKYNIVNICLAVFFCIVLFRYLYISIGILPYMDYWIDLSENIERVMVTPFVGIGDMFPQQHALHSAPGFMVINNIVMCISKVNNQYYVYGGFLFSVVNIIIITIWFNKYIEKQNYIINIILFSSSILSIINLNQWEIYGLFCNLSFMMRITIYLSMWLFLDSFLRKKEVNIKKCFVFCLLQFLVINWFSQAYYVGFFVAEFVVIAVVVVNDFVNEKDVDKRYILQVVVLFASGIGSCIYNIVTLQSGMASNGSISISLLEKIRDMFLGIILVLGGTVVPVTEQGDGCSYVYIIGTFIAIMAILAVVLFFETKMYEKTCFPVACMVYALVSAAVICYGRIYSYGLQSVTSSRYVVETTIGLLGMFLIFAYSISKVRLGLVVNKISICTIVTIIAVLMIRADIVEMKIGPGRKVYNENLVEMARDIDNVDDEELMLFQASPDQVRSGVKALKKYKLSIWAE